MTEDMLTEFQNTVKEVEEKEAALKAEYEELNELQDQLSEQQTEVQELIDSKEAQISDIQDEIKANAETLDRLKKEAEEAKTSPGGTGRSRCGCSCSVIIGRRKFIYSGFQRQCCERQRVFHTSLPGK